MKTRAICWILFFLSLASHAHASQHRTDCSKQEAIAAEKEAVKLDSVVSLYDSYKRFAHCDDGSIAEGYNESVVRILTQQWNRQLIELYRLASRDERFRAFVLRHINEAMTREQQTIILTNARDRCLKEAQKLCNQIMKAAIRGR